MKKIGRNDPCPCGSGKKFKNCHLGKEEEMVSTGATEFSEEMSKKITSLQPVFYGRSKEIADALDIQELTGSSTGIKFIDLKAYHDLDVLGRRPDGRGSEGKGGIIVNALKTLKTDPDHIYVAISPNITDAVLAHELAHVLDMLGGAKLMPGLATPLSFEIGIPVEHVEHPHEFGYWLTFLAEKFNIQLDADDAIIVYLYRNDMLIKGDAIAKGDSFMLKTKSEQILKFMGEHSAEIDALICELPGYIGSRVNKD